jgi:GNAT superfamily N-acetyltransferase
MEIRPYREGDEQGFLELDNFVEVHPWNRRDLTNWRWKYTGENPAGESIMYYADNNGEIVGHFAAIPMWYWINGEQVRASHSIAMMIKPEWQNRGLIKFVGDKLLKDLEAQNFPFTYGYPNENAYELHIQFWKYTEIAQQTLFERKLDSTSNILLQEFSTSLIFKKIEKFDDSVNTLWEENKNHFKAIVIRNSNFLNWRYLARPDVSYYSFGAYENDRLVGYCVLKLYQEDQILRGHFVDLFTSPHEKEYGQFLIQKALDFFQQKKANEVNLWMQGSSFFQELLGQYGFEKGKSRPMICRFNVDQVKFKPIMTEDNWYFTMGDTLEVY